MSKKKRLSAFSKEFWMERGYNEEEAIIEAKSKRPCNKEYWLKQGYSENESVLKVSNHQKKAAKCYSKKRKENPDKYKASFNTCIEYWIEKGYNEEEAKLKLKERQSTNSIKSIIKRNKCSLGEAQQIRNKITKKWIDTLSSKTEDELENINKRKGITLENLTSKYGEEKAIGVIQKWKLSLFDGSEKWMVNKYGEIAGKLKYDLYKEKLKGRFTKDWFMDKYGEMTGKLKYDERSEFCRYKLTYEYYVEKYGEIEAKNIFYMHGNSIGSFIGRASKLSLKVFLPIYKYLRKEGVPRECIHLGVNGSKEKYIYSKKNKTCYYYDFCVEYNNLKYIIEFNGEHVHPNPNTLTKNEWLLWEHTFNKKDADTIFEYDKYKNTLANQNGYQVLSIWSSVSKIDNIEKCKQFLKNNME